MFHMEHEIELCKKCKLPHGQKFGRQRERYADGKCPLCAREKPEGLPYCKDCRNQYNRGHRPKYSELSDVERAKSNARAYLRVYISRGIVKRGPCRVCGKRKRVQAHHTDYSKPLLVDWLCHIHHREEHQQ